jgi:hypothetical protein
MHPARPAVNVGRADAQGNAGDPAGMKEERGCRRLSVTDATDADRRADLVWSLMSAPEAVCIQFSRLDRCEGGEDRDFVAPNLLRAFSTVTYYI